MKRLHSFGTIACGITALCLTVACSQDELPGNTPSDELQPLVLQTNLQPATRGTVNNQWDDGEQVCVSVTETLVVPSTTSTYTYTADASGNLASNTPYYWRKTQGWELLVCAWYPTDLTDGSTRNLPTDQSSEENFQRADALYAPQRTFTYSKNGPYRLDFYHQNVKLVVNVLNRGMAAGYQGDVSLRIGSISNEGYYSQSEPATNPYGSWQSITGSENITPYRLSEPNVVDGTQTVASFEAIVLPQTVNANNILFSFTLNGKIYTYKVPSGGITWSIGQKYIYDVTIAGQGDVTVSNITVSPWTEQDGGNLETE